MNLSNAVWNFTARKSKRNSLFLFEENPRTPTHIWLDAKIRELSMQGIGIYVTHKGEKMSGLVLLKLVASPQECKLLTQQRNFETNALEWVNVFQEDIIEEKRADEYILSLIHI